MGLHLKSNTSFFLIVLPRWGVGGSGDLTSYCWATFNGERSSFFLSQLVFWRFYPLIGFTNNIRTQKFSPSGNVFSVFHSNTQWELQVGAQSSVDRFLRGDCWFSAGCFLPHSSVVFLGVYQCFNSCQEKHVLLYSRHCVMWRHEQPDVGNCRMLNTATFH